jgi:hypothetical protein
MSPRSTHALHKRGELGHLASVVLVGLKSGDLSRQRSPLPEATGAVEESPADSFGSAEAGRLKLRKYLEFSVERVTRIELALSAWELYGAAWPPPADKLTCWSTPLCPLCGGFPSRRPPGSSAGNPAKWSGLCW